MRKCNTRMVGVFLTLGLVLSPALTAVVRADKLRQDTALEWAPSSVGFYGSILRWGEQWDKFKSSKAYAKLMGQPLVQMGVGQIQSRMQDPDGPMGEFVAFMEDPEHAELVQVMNDLVRHEVVLFGDDRVGTMLHELNQINRSSTRTQLESLKSGADRGAAEKAMVDAMIQSVENIEVPNFFMGFRVSDEAMAKRQIPLIEKMIREAIETEAPEFAARIKSKEINGAPFLQVSLDGEMIPWDKLNEDGDLTDEQIESLKKALSSREVFVTLGVHKGYMFALLGSVRDPIRIFSSNKLLIDVPELKRLRDMDGKQFTTIGFASNDFMRNVSRPQEDIDQMVTVADALLPQAQLDKEIEQSLLSDAKELASDIKRMIPEQGAMLSFEYLSENGYEGYQQSWAENIMLDGSKTLDILKHVGGDPIAMIVGRAKDNPAFKGFFSKWMSKGIHYAEHFAMQSDPDEEDVALYESFKNAMSPFGEQISKVTKEYFAPAMADGQSAFVLDSKLEPKTLWHPAMPDLDQEPLGMLEFAEIYAVSDVDKLEKAFAEYKSITEDAIDKIKEVTTENQEALMERLSGQAVMLPMMIQSLQLPNPDQRESANGKLYYLGALAATGLDQALAPAWGWSNQVLVFASTPDAVDRILASEPVKGPLSEMANRELAIAAHLNFAKLMSTLKPWVRYGMNVAAERQDNQMISMVAPQVEALMDVVSCFRQHTSVTFDEGDSLVTYYRQEFRDLE